MPSTVKKAEIVQFLDYKSEPDALQALSDYMRDNPDYYLEYVIFNKRPSRLTATFRRKQNG